MPEKVLMLFVDGVGIGENDASKNPFFRYGFSPFTHFFGAIPHTGLTHLSTKHGHIFPVDAVQGVKGTPQSGTGQTSIFCGVNAQEIIGEHFGPYPYSTLLPVIEEKNIFSTLLKKKRKVHFANAYPKAFFEYIKGGRTRQSVTTLSAKYAGMKLHNGADVRAALALTAEITGERWNEKLGYKLRVLTPEGAANRLLRIAGKNHYTLYEFFLTDYLGHGRLPGMEEYIHKVFERFVHTLLLKLPENVTLLVCSDHGNYEDTSIKSHTVHSSLGLSYGKGAQFFRERISSLYDIHPAVVDWIR